MPADAWPEVRVLRHAQTSWNLAARMQGHTDIELDEVGRSQTRTIAERQRADPPSRIVSSDLSRALETARGIGVACGIEPTIDPRLREQHLGTWGGSSFAEVEVADPERARQFRARDPDTRPPEGETRAELSARVWAAFSEHAARGSSGPLLLVSHGGAIESLIYRVLGLPLTAARRFRLDNVGLSTFVHRGDAWFVRTLNDTSHLDVTSGDRFPFE